MDFLLYALLRAFVALVRRARNTVTPFRRTRASKPLALIHTDICGPQATPSFNGSLYMLVLVDDFSRYTWVYFLKLKSECLSIFKVWLTMVEKEKIHKVVSLRSDNGGVHFQGVFVVLQVGRHSAPVDYSLHPFTEWDGRAEESDYCGDG